MAAGFRDKRSGALYCKKNECPAAIGFRVIAACQILKLPTMAQLKCIDDLPLHFGVKMIDADADLTNADWPKQTFDFPGITNVDETRRYLEATGTTIEAFKKRPVYKLNVDKIPWLREL